MTDRRRRIAVLGGRGFIGSALVDLFAREGHQVTVLSQAPFREPSRTTERIQIDYIRDSGAFFRDRPFDEVHFLAGNSSPHASVHQPLLDLRKTNLPWMAVLESLRVQRFSGRIWLASSVAVYGDNAPGLLQEDSECRPLSFYALSRLAAEQALQFHVRVSGLKGGVYRIFSTYGPGLSRQLVFDVISKLRADPEKIEIVGDGSEARDLSYVDDQVGAIKLLADSVEPRGDTFNVGSGTAYSVREVVSQVAREMSISPQVLSSGPRREFDGRCWQADVSKIRQLGFSPECDLSVGLRRTIDWYDSIHGTSERTDLCK